MNDRRALAPSILPGGSSRPFSARPLLTRQFVARATSAFRLAAFGALALMAGISGAAAQSPACDQYRAELSSLSRGDPRAAAQAGQIRGEIGRLQAYRSQLGCDRGFLFFGDRPPQCGQVDARIRSLQGAWNSAQGQAQGNPARRQALMAAIARYCSPGAGQAREPNFFERLFGGGQPTPPPPQEQQQYEMNTHRQATENSPRYGGSRVVCVRACDGFFFPLPSNRREDADEMCQALCPSTQTLVYFMSGDGAIERAGNREGKPYTELPTAGKYKKSFDPACGCKKPDESWATALQPAENMLKSGRGDMIVTAEKAEELSRPKGVAAARSKPEPAPAADQDEDAPVDPSTLPTASNESSGIGPQTINEDQTVGAREGQIRETVGQSGQRAKVRVVAPNIFAAPTEPGKER